MAQDSQKPLLDIDHHKQNQSYNSTDSSSDTKEDGDTFDYLHSKSLECDKLIELLRKYDIIISDEIDEAQKLSQLFAKYNYNEGQLRNEICKGFLQNDEGLIIHEILFEELSLGYKLRQAIYDIALHEYFELNELNVENMMNISQTIIKQLKLDDIIDTYVFKDIIRRNRLNGNRFMKLQNSRQFANYFKSMNVNSSKFGKIFVQLKRNWKPRDYSKMKVKQIKLIEFMSDEDDDDDDDDSDDQSDDIDIEEERKYGSDSDMDEDEDEDKIKHCREDNTLMQHNEKDPLPRYLYKSVKCLKEYVICVANKIIDNRNRFLIDQKMRHWRYW